MKEQTQPEYLTLRQATEKLQINRRTLLRHMQAGKLKYYMIAGMYRIKPEDLQAWIDSQNPQNKEKKKRGRPLGSGGKYKVGKRPTLPITEDLNIPGK